MTAGPTADLHGFSFSGHAGSVTAFSNDEVLPALRMVEEQAVRGLHAAGFVSYEAAPGINPELSTKVLRGFPLLRFDFFRERTSAPLSAGPGAYEASAWRQTVGEKAYLAAIEEIRRLIAAGDCYQVNFTFAHHFSFAGAPRAFFQALVKAQPTPFASFLEVGPFRILSVSPELFFSLHENVITTRPMKGTAPRGTTSQDDQEAIRDLRENPKERAENLMIVDLLRNDLGVVAETGSVTVPSLFDVETLPTVHQMTSTVTARLKEGTTLAELFQALFPCGSITGAPKRRTMEIIAELEQEPRGIYTGCIGYVSPDRSAQFSVAIRTLVIDTTDGSGVMGIGSGVTYDSNATSEYAECLAKGRFARREEPDFHLIESLLHDRDGYFLLERHLDRMGGSAVYFGFSFVREEARELLETEAARLQGAHKVRLLLFREGRLHCESAALPEAAGDAVVAFARSTTDPENRFLYHKTSRRELYAAELAARPDCSEVIFTNCQGEVTEGSYSNIVAKVDGELVTPPLSCGLLGGVFREELLEGKDVREKKLTVADLMRADEIYVINSVRKWRRARLIE